MHPVLFSFDNPVTGASLQVTTYAALMFLGVAASIGLSSWLARRRGLPAFDVFAAGAIAFGVGFLGARLAFLLLNGKPEGVPWSVFLTTSGGLVWYGGFAGGALGALLYLRGYRIPLLPMIEIAGPGLALGHAFGRLGCFTAGCCHGAFAPDAALTVVFPPGGLAPPGIPLHPVQLYEAGALLLLSGALLVLHLRLGERWREGTTFALYLGGYAVLRFFTEMLRDDDRGGFLAGLSPAQWTSIVLLVLLGAALIWVRKSADDNDMVVKA
ncbi:MAG: prolipoprotein diacylglyceryl transferase [Deltaproteobacteria bacterium]|nr:prolipoprotein diacylglyceryl transferase [Deltaproteobacteria bacterium]